MQCYCAYLFCQTFRMQKFVTELVHKYKIFPSRILPGHSSCYCQGLEKILEGSSLYLWRGSVTNFCIRNVWQKMFDKKGLRVTLERLLNKKRVILHSWHAFKKIHRAVHVGLDQLNTQKYQVIPDVVQTKEEPLFPNIICFFQVYFVCIKIRHTTWTIQMAKYTHH